MRNISTFLLTVIILMAAVTATAQTVKGRVVDAENNSPLNNASVKVVGSGLGTTTDADGRFTITVAANGQLEISYVGYDTKRVSVNNQSDLLIQLVGASSMLTDVTITTGA